MTEAVRREITVPLDVDRAFALFTEGIGSWWPLDRFGVFGDGSVAVENGRIVERSGEREAVWGMVTHAEAPAELDFTWHPGYEEARATSVNVRFAANEGGTLVTLVHDGWHVLEQPDATAADYDAGWPLVLAELRNAALGAIAP